MVNVQRSAIALWMLLGGLLHTQEDSVHGYTLHVHYFLISVVC